VNRAIEQRENGRYACALKNLQIGLELDPTPFESSRISYTFASIYIAKREPAKALEYSNLGLEVEEVSNDLLHLSKGIAHCMMQQNMESIQEFNLFLDLTPDSVGLLAVNVQDILDDLIAGKNMSDVCQVRLGTELMP
jgi:tetratricopeptide (TPR) repeat protein